MYTYTLWVDSEILRQSMYHIRFSSLYTLHYLVSCRTDCGILKVEQRVMQQSCAWYCISKAGVRKLVFLVLPSLYEAAALVLITC